MKIIAITGFNSFIGSNFYKKYKNKYKIIKYKKDINNYPLINEFIKKNNFDYFVHLAAVSRSNSIKNNKKCMKTNYYSLKKIINYLKKKKNNILFIFMSTSHVYAPTTKNIKENFKRKTSSVYGLSKMLSENYISKNYVNYCILRLFNVYGKGQKKGYFIPDVIDKIKQKKTIVINNSKRDFININEVLRILDYIISKNIRGIYNVGSGRSYYLNKIIKILGAKLKIRPYIKIHKKNDSIISDNSLIKKSGYKFLKNERYLNI